MKYFFLLSLLLPVTMLSQHNVGKDKLAVEGYDVVAYFSNEVAPGKANLTHSHDGIQYRFANQANLERFRSHPTKYIPQYGGWCAYAMGESGKKVDVNPKTFKVTDGKLYLFYNKFFTNTLEEWNKDENGWRKKADTNWAKISKSRA